MQTRPFFQLAAIFGLIFTILGFYFVYIVKKSKKKKKLFLLLTGSSAALILPSVILHNMFYAFAILAENIILLKYLFEFLHGMFFIIALIIAPLCFMVSMIVILAKRKEYL
jgi:hypothetical protein